MNSAPTTVPPADLTAMTTTPASTTSLVARYAATRAFTERLCANLTIEDHVVQSMPDASPAKWHLAHTTWFFETFVLEKRPGFEPFDATFRVLFNSYYNGVGEQFTRADRGLLSRPSVERVRQYRAHVDARMAQVLAGDVSPELAHVVEVGLNHEQQHQELLVTDLGHMFARNPLHPVVVERPASAARAAREVVWSPHDADVYEVGHDGDGFSFDNETPRHRVFLEPFAIADRPSTNREYIDFIEDGGYANPSLWLSEGWATVQSEGWSRPLYWVERDGEWFRKSWHGLVRLDPNAPVCPLSFFEADAFAAWSGARLPTEFEWEVASEHANPGAGHFADSMDFVPRVVGDDGGWFGHVWEWTSSSYAAYPGFKALPGALGEYNGKFMCNQYVLRGGSSATPAGHVRRTYRNFFPASARWQVTGIRLARSK